MSRALGRGLDSLYKFWSRVFKVDPVNDQSLLIDEVIDRARKSAVDLLDASEFHQDPTVRNDVLDQLNAEASGAAVRYAGALVDQLKANEETRLGLKHEKAKQNNRIGGLVLCIFLAFGLLSIADIGSGRGGLSGVKAGWREDVEGIGSVLLLVAAGLGISAAVTWFNGRSGQLDKDRETLDRETTRLRRDVDSALEAEWVRPIVTRVLETRLKPTFSSKLRAVDVSMFGGPPATPIDTYAFVQVTELISGSNGASIGLCGPRGVGKTTLIRRFCDSSRGGDASKIVGICVDVPVAYAQRDFLANIYSRLIGEVELRMFRGPVQREVPASRHLLKRGVALFLILAAAVSAIVVTKGWRLSRLHIETPKLDWQSITAISIAFIAGLALIFFPAFSSRRHSRPADAERDPIHDLRDSAARGRLNLNAEVATSSSIGGSVALFGAGVARSGTRQVSRGLLSYPDLVEEFRKFVKQIAAARIQTRIGIDELDKLTPDDARSFLNGLKAIFGLDNTHFLVSVSEDAMSDFERRGLPIRDAFDSSLDEVARIDELTVEESMRLLSECGNYDFPQSFGALCHCLSGGLPRELLRVARQLVRYNARIRSGSQYGQMKPLCEHLIADDLEAKSDALWVVARGINVEPYTMRFRSWLANSDENRQSPERLLSSCNAYLEFPTVEAGELAKVPGLLPAVERLGSLALEFAGYRYFAATLLGFFSQAADAELRRALSADAGIGSLKTLSSARARFADDPRLAWSLVTQFRQGHNIDPALPVPTEGWRLPPSQTPPSLARRNLV